MLDGNELFINAEQILIWIDNYVKFMIMVSNLICI